MCIKLKNKFTWLFFLCLMLFLNSGCRKIIKKPKIKPKSVISSSSGAMTALFIVGGTLISREVFAKNYENRINLNNPISPRFTNTVSPNINLEISFNGGASWEERAIELGETIKVPSDGSGLIGVKNNTGEFYQIETSDSFITENENGIIKFITN